MSSGMVQLSPAAASLAHGQRSLADAAAVAATPARAAVLLVRAAITGTPGLDGALGRLAAALADPADYAVPADRAAVEVEVRWQLAADAVLGVNVERRLLRAALECADTVPPAVPLAGRTQREALAACQDWVRQAGTARRTLATQAPPSPAVRGWPHRREAGAAAALLEGLAAMDEPADPGLVRALDDVVTGRSAEVADPVRAAALAELGRLAASREW